MKKEQKKLKYHKNFEHKIEKKFAIFCIFALILRLNLQVGCIRKKIEQYRKNNEFIVEICIKIADLNFSEIENSS